MPPSYFRHACVGLAALCWTGCNPVGSVEVEAPSWLKAALADAAKQAVTPPPLTVACKKLNKVDEIEGLAAPGRTIVRCCDEGSASEFVFGCMINHECVYLISTATGWITVKNRKELAAAIGPIRSPAQALGVVALLDQNHSLKGAQPSLELLDASPKARTLKVVGAEVQTSAKGYSVRVADGPFCTCPRSVTVQTYEVTAEGAVMHRATDTVADDGADRCLE